MHNKFKTAHTPVLKFGRWLPHIYKTKLNKAAKTICIHLPHWFEGVGFALLADNTGQLRKAQTLCTLPNLLMRHTVARFTLIESLSIMQCVLVDWGKVPNTLYLIPLGMHLIHCIVHVRGIVSTQMFSLSSFYCTIKLFLQLLYLVVENGFLLWLAVEASTFILHLYLYVVVVSSICLCIYVLYFKYLYYSHLENRFSYLAFFLLSKKRIL